MSKPVRFTDTDRFPYGPYADAKASQEPGYLAARFAAIRARQQATEAEKNVKLRELKTARK